MGMGLPAAESSDGNAPAAPGLNFLEGLDDSHSGSALSVGPPLQNSSRTLSLLRVDSNDTTLGGVLGGKTIGWFGSFALTINNITGPGMLHLATVFQRAGLVVPLIVFIVVCVTSTGAAALLCDAMARMPGNSQLEARNEYSDIFHFYIPGSFTCSQVFFYLGILTQTLASIVGTAQSMDGLIVLLFGRSWAWQVFGGSLPSPRFVTWSPEVFCKHLKHASECAPFASFYGAPDIGCIITAGYVATLILLAPFGFWNLDDNIKFQIFSFFVLVALTVVFLLDMWIDRGLIPSRIPLFGDDYSPVLGTIMFNFAYCPTIPSWLNEKRPEVRVAGVLWSAAIGATVMYLFVGVISAMAFSNTQSNILQEFSAGRHVWLISKISAFLFGVLVVGLGIPVFCIVMRYNLFVGGLCNKTGATFMGVILPWAVSWLLYQGRAAEVFISSSGVVLVSLVGFIGPLLVALSASRLEGDTICNALPRRFLHLQRRCVCVLLCVLVPLVLAGLWLELTSLEDM